jgi:hypothetical protein
VAGLTGFELPKLNFLFSVSGRVFFWQSAYINRRLLLLCHIPAHGVSFDLKLPYIAFCVREADNPACGLSVALSVPKSKEKPSVERVS